MEGKGRGKGGKGRGEEKGSSMKSYLFLLQDYLHGLFHKQQVPESDVSNEKEKKRNKRNKEEEEEERKRKIFD